MAKTSSFSDMSAVERRELAARIRSMVDAAGSQQEAARLAKVSIRQIAAYTAGESGPPFVPVARLAAATGHDLNWVLTGQGPARLDGTYTPAAAMRDTPVDATRTKLEVRTARKLGAALERVYKVKDGELPPAIDDTVEDAARYIVALARDEAECVALVNVLAELHAARLKSNG